MKKMIFIDIGRFISNTSRSVYDSPARLSVLSFLLLILTGSFLLSLPVSTPGKSLAFVDAFFTATSASCVTGLSVIDIAAKLTLFGQIVLLCLIQVGGLGFMTLSTLFILLAGGKTRFSKQSLIKDNYSHNGNQSPLSILSDVIKFTLIFELAGAAVLFIRFYPVYGYRDATYYSIFHAVSAFCNAGFSLFSGNMELYCNDWIVNIVVMCLIIVGGLGFLVISELKTFLPVNKRNIHHLSLHTKIVLSATLFLIISGTLIILFTEWNNTLSSLSLDKKILAACFQSVTCRTAGFNTIPIDRLANETLLIAMIFMFVGANSGSCAGGIKTTTAATLVLLGFSRMRGQNKTSIFRCTIPEQNVTKATNLLMVSIFVVLFGTVLLLMTELGDLSHIESRGNFIELLFEVVSAFGTAGLSMGATETLSTAGRVIISAIMFIGRLGPLMIAIAISKEQSSIYDYAEESIMIG